MPRLRKLRRKQKFHYHVNRRRLNEKLTKLPKINCEAIRNAWDEKKSLNQNLTSMGLVADPNTHKGFKIRSGKELLKERDAKVEQSTTKIDITPEKAFVADAIEQEAKEAFKQKKSVAHPLPPEMYRKLCKFIDKFGEDYQAMAKDHTNYYQETPKQLKKQIERLKTIPQQWIPYLRSRGLISKDEAK